MRVSGEPRTESLSARLGYQGAVRAGEWMPVDIEVAAGGTAVEGNLQIQVEDSSAGYMERQGFTSQPSPFGWGPFGPTYTTAYDVPVQMPARSSAHIRTFLLTDIQNPTVSIRLRQSGQTMAGPATARAQTTRLMVGVLADQPITFETLATLHLPNNLMPRVVTLTAADLPDSAVLLRAFDLLAIDAFPMTTLTGAQQSALADYVNAGGALLLGTGGGSPESLRGLRAALLPMDIKGTTSLAQVAALPGVAGLTIVTGSLRGGRAWLEEAGQPLLVELPVGSGIVTLATFSFTAPPIADWSGTAGLLRQIAIRSSLRMAQANAAPASLAPGHGPIWGPLGFQGSVTKRSWFLMPDLGRAPVHNLPPVRLLGPLVGGYALLVGLLVFFVLRRLHRAAWLWFIAPAVALVPAGMVWLQSLRGPTQW